MLPTFLPQPAAELRATIAAALAQLRGLVRIDRSRSRARPEDPDHGGWTPWPFLLLPLAGDLTWADRHGWHRATAGTALCFAGGTLAAARTGRAHLLRLTLEPEAAFVAERRRGGPLRGALLAYRDGALPLALMAACLRAGDESAAIDCFRACLRSVAEPAPAHEAPVRGPLHLIERYLREQCHQPCSRAEVGAIFGLHGNHLPRLCRRELGCSYQELLLRVRVERAQRLLRESEWSIATIAQHCGYQSARAFARSFVRVAGCSPGAWRARAHGDGQ